METKAPQQAALDELRGDVKSPEELATLREWQNEIDTARADALQHGGIAVSELVQLSDGTIETKEHVQEEQAAGHDASSAYSQNRRA